MESFIIDMFSMIIRWLHIITGIAWIGASFYFIWLDNSLELPPEWKKEKGIQGDLWAFHGGGIYEVAKYRSGPAALPEKMHWFYWEAYSTWITGILLLFVIYYLQASTYLMAPDSLLDSPGQTIVASIIFICAGVLFYEGLLKGGFSERPLLFAILVLLMLGLASWIAVQLFSDRAAYIHIGILIGSIMVANVFIGIIPPQRRFVEAIENGRAPDLEQLRFAKLRSTHNNYFTLPVLFCMISNHYPVFYAHTYNWLILTAIIGITGAARHYFNLRQKGIYRPSILLICGLLFLLLCSAMAVERFRKTDTDLSMIVNDDRALAISMTHCMVCHAENPSFPGFNAAPLGVSLASSEQLKLHAAKIREVVDNNYMPLGNITKMTAEERQQLIAWASQQ